MAISRFPDRYLCAINFSKICLNLKKTTPGIYIFLTFFESRNNKYLLQSCTLRFRETGNLNCTITFLLPLKRGIYFCSYFFLSPKYHTCTLVCCSHIYLSDDGNHYIFNFTFPECLSTREYKADNLYYYSTIVRDSCYIDGKKERKNMNIIYKKLVRYKGLEKLYRLDRIA